jgi:hypothetical protein
MMPVVLIVSHAAYYTTSRHAIFCNPDLQWGRIIRGQRRLPPFYATFCPNTSSGTGSSGAGSDPPWKR